jgi:hypothetical protein
MWAIEVTVRGRSARRGSTPAGSTRCLRWGAGCCGPRGCSTPPISASCGRGDRLPGSQRLHPRAAIEDALQPDGQRRPTQASRGWRRSRLPGRCRRARGGAAAQPERRGVTRYLVRWRGHTSADDEWLRAEELAHCQDKVAEYDAAAPRRPGTRRVLQRCVCGRQTYRSGSGPCDGAARARGCIRFRGFRRGALVSQAWPTVPARRLRGGAVWSTSRWPLDGWVRRGLKECWSQPGRRVLARGALRTHVHPQLGVNEHGSS